MNSSSGRPCPYADVIRDFSRDLLNVSADQELYRLVAASMRKLIPAGFFIISWVMPDGKNVRIVEHHGFSEYLPRLLGLVGVDPFSIDFPITELNEEELKKYRSRNLNLYPEGLYALSIGKIPPAICRAVERTIGVAEVYAMGFAVEEIHYGGITILVTRRMIKEGLWNSDISGAVETMVNLISIIIKKNRAKQELHDIVSARDKLFYMLAHDLRSPFSALLGLSELMADPDEATDPETMRLMAVKLHRLLNTQFNLLQNLLEWARLQTGGIEPVRVPVTVAEIIRGTIALFREQADHKHILIKNHAVDSGISVLADVNMLKSILQNLLVNAIKFTAAYGAITFSNMKMDNRVIIRITDTGIGMHEDQISQLFRRGSPFTTPGTEGEQGTGLGLILSREFATKLDGNLGVESSPGKGSTFTLELPGLPDSRS